MNENPEPKVLFTCPVCNASIMAGDFIIASQYLMTPVPGTRDPQVSFPKVACLQCGVEFFPPEVLIQLKSRAEEGSSLIVVPKGPINVQRN